MENEQTRKLGGLRRKSSSRNDYNHHYNHYNNNHNNSNHASKSKARSMRFWSSDGEVNDSQLPHYSNNNEDDLIEGSFSTVSSYRSTKLFADENNINQINRPKSHHYPHSNPNPNYPRHRGNSIKGEDENDDQEEEELRRVMENHHEISLYSPRHSSRNDSNNGHNNNMKNNNNNNNNNNNHNGGLEYVALYQNGDLFKYICGFLDQRQILTSLPLISKACKNALHRYSVRIDLLVNHPISIKNLLYTANTSKSQNSKGTAKQWSRIGAFWDVAGIKVDIEGQSVVSLSKAPSLSLSNLQTLEICNIQLQPNCNCNSQIAFLLDECVSLNQVKLLFSNTINLPDNEALLLIQTLVGRMGRYDSFYTNLLELTCYNQRLIKSAWASCLYLQRLSRLDVIHGLRCTIGSTNEQNGSSLFLPPGPMQVGSPRESATVGETSIINALLEMAIVHGRNGRGSALVLLYGLHVAQRYLSIPLFEIVKNCPLGSDKAEFDNQHTSDEEVNAGFYSNDPFSIYSHNNHNSNSDSTKNNNNNNMSSPSSSSSSLLLFNEHHDHDGVLKESSNDENTNRNNKQKQHEQSMNPFGNLAAASSAASASSSSLLSGRGRSSPRRSPLPRTQLPKQLSIDGPLSPKSSLSDLRYQHRYKSKVKISSTFTLPNHLADRNYASQLLTSLWALLQQRLKPGSIHNFLDDLFQDPVLYEKESACLISAVNFIFAKVLQSPEHSSASIRQGLKELGKYSRSSLKKRKMLQNTNLKNGTLSLISPQRLMNIGGSKQDQNEGATFEDPSFPSKQDGGSNSSSSSIILFEFAQLGCQLLRDIDMKVETSSQQSITTILAVICSNAELALLGDMEVIQSQIDFYRDQGEEINAQQVKHMAKQAILQATKLLCSLLQADSSLQAPVLNSQARTAAHVLEICHPRVAVRESDSEAVYQEALQFSFEIVDCIMYLYREAKSQIEPMTGLIDFVFQNVPHFPSDCLHDAIEFCSSLAVSNPRIYASKYLDIAEEVVYNFPFDWALYLELLNDVFETLGSLVSAVEADDFFRICRCVDFVLGDFYSHESVELCHKSLVIIHRGASDGFPFLDATSRLALVDLVVPCLRLFAKRLGPKLSPGSPYTALYHDTEQLLEYFSTDHAF